MSATFTPNTPGIFFDLPEETYRQAPGVNISNLKAMSMSPLHYWQRVNGLKEDPTPAMIFGSIFHRAILEPRRDPGFVVKPEEVNLRTKEGQAWKAARTLPIIDQEQADAIKAAIKAIESHPMARAILSAPQAKKEVSIFKIHEPTGILMKGRLDVLTTDNENNTVVLDLKTTDDASLGGFTRAIGKWDYASQSAYYLDLIGGQFFTFIAIEKEAPHGIGIYNLDAESIEIGRQKNEANLARLAECLKTNAWPGYPQEIQTISVPKWMKYQAQETATTA